MTAPQTPGAPAKASLMDDFIEIFTSPSTVFARRSGAGFGIPFVIIFVVAFALFLAAKGVMQPAMDAEWPRITARAMAQNPNVTAAQMDQGRAFFEKFGVIIYGISVPIAILGGGLILWLVGKIFGATESLKDALMVATYSWIVRVVGLIVVIVIALLMDPANMTGFFAPSASLARFLNPDTTGQKMMFLASRVDVFVIWQTILLGIGLSVTGKISRAQGIMAAVLGWILGTGIAAMLQR